MKRKLYTKEQIVFCLRPIVVILYSKKQKGEWKHFKLARSRTRSCLPNSLVTQNWYS
jgi:hypothetical protein